MGTINAIQDIKQGRFSQAAVDDLSNAGRNVLVFVAGFDNSFENAITRAACEALVRSRCAFYDSSAGSRCADDGGYSNLIFFVYPVPGVHSLATLISGAKTYASGAQIYMTRVRANDYASVKQKLGELV